MTKGKPWPPEDEKSLKTWFTTGTTDLRVLAFSLGGRYTEEAVRQKLIKLGLIEQQQTAANCCCSSNLELPEEMPSVEEALKTLCAALKALETPGLDKSEVLRLRSIISGIKTYKELLVDYLDYRGLEQRLLELEGNTAHLAQAKNHRRMPLPDVWGHRNTLDSLAKDHEAELLAHVLEVFKDTLKFLEQYCKLNPYWYVLELVRNYEQFQFNAVRRPRQTGKSTTIGALHLADAWNNPDLNIGFVGPSWRQTKLNIRRVASFCRNLPQQGLHIQKTKISFPNGSVIEAFPNNPDTIRGNTFHRIWWDEVNFTANDEDLYDAILFTLGTTNGKLTASSTPFNTDALF